MTAERGKTDDSLLDLRKKAERETDAVVKRDRNKADETRAQQRNNRDLKKTANTGTVNQRLADDKTVQSERLKADAAIQNERAEKERVLSEFLQQERGETDNNLSHERDQTDIAVRNTAKLLTDEMGQHSKTKADLTTRDELLAIVSHDLRNPIGTVLSCADMLLQDPEFSGMSPELKYWIQLMKRNAETSLRLIGDILDMERIAEGKLGLNPKEQSLSKVIRETIESFAQLASTNGILLRAALSTNDVVALFDRDRILQVLSNLIGNALKFTPEGGSIVLSVQQVNNETIVSIQDTGIGIPEKEKERIFVRYAQIGKKDRRGLGLGLYISKTLIEAHGGNLWATTAQEKGSTFHFSLPNRPA